MRPDPELLDAAARPQLSVVIASVNGPRYLDLTLAALSHQRGTVNAEVIVADRCGLDVTSLVTTKYPWVRLYSLDEQLTIPQLRAIGMRHSQGDVIATTEDHCLPPADWYERILAAHAEHPYLAIGGTIENAATDRLVDWAVFLCEYSADVPPLPAGVVSQLPGPNVAYKRATLQYVQDLLDAGEWEMALHAQLRKLGFELYRDPAVVVRHRQFFGVREFVSQRFHYARGFAGMRLAGASIPRRLAFAAASPILPPVILWRIWSRLSRRRRHRLILAKSLPLLALFSVAWSLGELVGYLTGPGDSLARVR